MIDSKYVLAVIHRVERLLGRKRLDPCIECIGTGSVVIDVEPDGLVLVDICPNCAGTGWTRH